MKILKGVALTLAFLPVFIFAACGDSEYSDLKEVMDAQTNSMEKYVNALENAASAEEAAAAIDNFTSDLKILIPEMKKTLAKHPELAGNNEPPEELKEEVAAMQAVNDKMRGAMMKIMKYMQDPSVQKAMEKQGKLMMEIDQK